MAMLNMFVRVMVMVVVLDVEFGAASGFCMASAAPTTLMRRWQNLALFCTIAGEHFEVMLSHR